MAEVIDGQVPPNLVLDGLEGWPSFFRRRRRGDGVMLRVFAMKSNSDHSSLPAAQATRGLKLKSY